MRWLAIFCFAASGAVFALQYGPVWTVLVMMALAAAVLLWALGLAFGSCYTTLYTALFVRPAAAFADTEQTVTLTLCAYPVEHTFGVKVRAELDAGGVCPVSVQFYGDETLMDCKPGDSVTAEVDFRSASVVHGEKITSFTSKGMHLLAYGQGELVIHPAERLPLRFVPL